MLWFIILYHMVHFLRNCTIKRKFHWNQCSQISRPPCCSWQSLEKHFLYKPELISRLLEWRREERVWKEDKRKRRREGRGGKEVKTINSLPDLYMWILSKLPCTWQRPHRTMRHTRFAWSVAVLDKTFSPLRTIWNTLLLLIFSSTMQ